MKNLFDIMLECYRHYVDIHELPNYEGWCRFLDQLDHHIDSYDRNTLTEMWKTFDGIEEAE